jgi:hypothetical protein
LDEIGQARPPAKQPFGTGEKLEKRRDVEGEKQGLGTEKRERELLSPTEPTPNKPCLFVVLFGLIKMIILF